jgi:hypothetical protein
MPGSPSAYVEKAVGGRVTPIGLPPPQQSGTIDFGRTFLSLGAAFQVSGVALNIVCNDGSNKPGFPQVITVRQGRREVFELGGGPNHDALTTVNLLAQTPTTEVSVLVETDSP